MTENEAPPLIRALMDPAVYDHPAPSLRLLQTHISWVILTGSFAYKIKKPVDLGFLDFSSLEKRGFYCREELRLNRRLAPELYLDVVEIKGTAEKPRLGGRGGAIEYAVKMNEFPQEALLDRVLRRGELSPAMVDSLSRAIARFHSGAPAADPKSPFGTPERVRAPVDQNFEQISKRISASGDRERLERLREWSELEFKERKGAIKARKAGGFIRELHGDMHLGNMALVDGEIVIFDCIEFNEYLRWIDVMGETAFLVMDLADHGRAGLSWRALDEYLAATGDYGGLSLLRYYLVYRALVRAKVASIRLAQEKPGQGDEESAHYRDYFTLAEKYASPPHPKLIITHGLSGAGKTAVSQKLLESMGAVRVRSDVERKRLFGLAPDERAPAAVGEGLYAPEVNRGVYLRLVDIAKTIIGAGLPVIVDAAFLKTSGRAAFRSLAETLGVPFAILDVTADEDVLRKRVAKREAEGADASDATVAVLEEQIRTHEPLSERERAFSIRVDTTKGFSLEDVEDFVKSQPMSR
ncbi:MAG: AAA family ATPase [Candidatus Nitrospinota bacterium M3_3B_026]